MGKRGDLGYYPTDPFGVEALRIWLKRHLKDVLRAPLLDPCAGYGALLAGLVAQHRRHAIEIQPRLRAELARRVDGDRLRIGSGLDHRSWPTADGEPPNVVENPPFDNPTMTAFVEQALLHRANWGEGVAVIALSLSTWWHSEAAQSVFRRLGQPNDVLGLGFRITCDGSGVGDMRSHDWLVWRPSHLITEPGTRLVVLPKPTVSAELVAEHKRLSNITLDEAL